MCCRIGFLIADRDALKAQSVCREASARLREEGLDAFVFTGSAEEFCRSGDGKNLLVLADDPGALSFLSGKGLPAVGLIHAQNKGTPFPGAAYVFEEPQEIDADSYIKAYQRLTGKPWEILTTKRLRLRESTVDDVDAFYELYRDPAMTKYMEGLFADPADEKRYMADYIRNVYGLAGFGIWTVIEKESGQIIGRCGFSVRGGFDRPETGFLIGVPWQRKGYATEAVSACLSYAKDILGFESVQALVREGNDVSVHLLENLGFQKIRTIDIEEDIYGGVYPGFGEGRVTLSPARRGRYTEMKKNL